MTALPWKMLVLVLLAGHAARLSWADWIDPDTPWSARTTVPLNPIPPSHMLRHNFNSTNSTHSNSTHHNRTRHRHKTPSPTATPPPSNSPTASPSAYPTMVPVTFQLVFSDEFNTPYRTFDDGHDPRWTALDKNDYTNDALHYYTPKNVETNEAGELVVVSEARDTEIVGFDDVKGKRTHVTKHFRSAMLQTWNKFCFTGGILEAEVQLPGKPDVGGLWPALWLLGNLGRHTYVGSSMHLWPWSQLECSKKSALAQRISGCDEVAHYGLAAHLGRGAPEIDVFEIQAGNIRANHGPFLKLGVGQPFASASYQVAPGRPNNRPGPGEWPGPGQWYKGLTGGANASLNILFYGNYNHFLGEKSVKDYWSDAISYNRQLDAHFFNHSHVYRLEWDVPNGDRPGYLHWFLDGELVLAIDGKGLQEAGMGAEISSEPSYVLINTAISKQWGFPPECPSGCKCKKFDCHSQDFQERCGFSDGFCEMMINDPPKYKVNWVRVYQNPDDPVQKVGCSTPERPTRRYIEGHQDLYKTESDNVPLRPVARGGGTCYAQAVGVKPESCGGTQRGECTSGNTCTCKEGWTGPNCLAHQGSDPVLYDQPDKITDVGFIPPKIVPKFLLGVLGAIILMLLVALQWRSRFDGWTPIPQAERKPLLS